MNRLATVGNDPAMGVQAKKPQANGGADTGFKDLLGSVSQSPPKTDNAKTPHANSKAKPADTKGESEAATPEENDPQAAQAAAAVMAAIAPVIVQQVQLATEEETGLPIPTLPNVQNAIPVQQEAIPTVPTIPTTTIPAAAEPAAQQPEGPLVEILSMELIQPETSELQVPVLPVQAQTEALEDLGPSIFEAEQGLMEPNVEPEPTVPTVPSPRPQTTPSPSMPTDTNLIKPQERLVAPLDIEQPSMAEMEATAFPVPATKTAGIDVGTTEPTFQNQVKKEPRTDEVLLASAYHPLETAPRPVVQTQPAAAPVNTYQVPDQAEQIRARVVENLELNRLEFRMQLNPQELGKIDVRMLLENGRLSVEILAANPKAEELLSRQVQSLATSLRMGNVDVASINVVPSVQTTTSHMESAFLMNNQTGQSQQQSPQQTGRGSTNHNGTTNGNSGGDFDEPEDYPSSAPQERLNYTI